MATYRLPNACILLYPDGVHGTSHLQVTAQTSESATARGSVLNRPETPGARCDPPEKLWWGQRLSQQSIILNHAVTRFLQCIQTIN
jgi:hypothetical protein